MKNYSKNQISKLQPKHFTTVVNGTDTYLRAYLKENAVNYFQKIDSSIKESDVKISKIIGSGNVIDRIAEVEYGVFQIVIDEINEFGEITNRRDI